MNKTKPGRVMRYNRWGYIFLIPFFLVFIVFQLIPLGTTIYNSFFEHYFKNGLTEVGPNFIGLKNFKTLFSSGDILVYFKNTMIMWFMGFVPQIVVSLILAAWFSDPSLRLKGRKFFQSVIYMPILTATLRSADFLKFDMAQVYMFIFMAILPVIVVYLFMARSIVAGMTAGAVKG